MQTKRFSCKYDFALNVYLVMVAILQHMHIKYKTFQLLQQKYIDF